MMEDMYLREKQEIDALNSPASDEDYCPDCGGLKSPDGSCWDCGQEIDASTEEKDFCPDCGYPRNECKCERNSEAYCPDCGKPLFACSCKKEQEDE